MEMKCYQRLLAISCKDHITNAEVRKRITKALGPNEDLLTTSTAQKLKRYEHVPRSTGLAKTILQGTVQRKSKRGRQRRWKKNIT